MRGQVTNLLEVGRVHARFVEFGWEGLAVLVTLVVRVTCEEVVLGFSRGVDSSDCVPVPEEEEEEGSA